VFTVPKWLRVLGMESGWTFQGKGRMVLRRTLMGLSFLWEGMGSDIGLGSLEWGGGNTKIDVTLNFKCNAKPHAKPPARPVRGSNFFLAINEIPISIIQSIL